MLIMALVLSGPGVRCYDQSVSEEGAELRAKTLSRGQGAE